MSFSFLSSYLLVLVALLYAKWYKIGLEKSIFTSSLRVFIQLLLLGFVLSYIFEITNIWLEILILLFIMSGMILAGASPLKAVSYQLVIMYIILAVSLLASVFAIRLSYRKILKNPLND